MERVKVRTVFRPNKETEVPADEAEMLRAQGLLIKDEPEPAARAVKPAAKAAGSDRGATKEQQ
jgi:hypothetical protein